MSVTLELPADLENAANAIPDMPKRIELFIRQQVAHEQWKKGRYSEEARRLVAEGLIQAEKSKTDGITREQAAEGLLDVLDKIKAQLDQ